MSEATVLNVAVNVPLARRFDYLPPADGPTPTPGCRVVVPFGRRRDVGLVLACSDSSELPASKLRRAHATLDESPILSASDLWLVNFTSAYYHHPVGEVAAAALPALLRQGKDLYPTMQSVAVSAAGESTDITLIAKRAPRQAELFGLLLDAGGDGIDVETLVEVMPSWRRAANALLEKGLIEKFERRSLDPDDSDTDLNAAAGPALNAHQLATVNAINSNTGFSVAVLDGITGSGKTEVYLHLISEAIASGKQSLVLVPEIGLTPQLVSRMRERLGVQPVVLHSGLTNLERLRAWRMARAADARLIVGTRSAIFTPMPELGLVVVDEEHDSSFKQQEGLRYSARDLAIARAKHESVPIVLGSATPSLELLQHCREGDYVHLRLPERAGNAQPPVIKLVDMNRAAANDGISPALADAIRVHLADDGQVLIYLNRRGYAPTLICAACGHIAECTRCDSRMTVHASDGQLRCHHCGSSRPLDNACSECGSQVRPLGEGTERLEESLRCHFPQQRVTRIDSDSMQKKGAMDSALSLATEGDADILVGTQMLSKGHHFPKLSLVGVVNADQGLFGTDFRSDERLAQSIIQVAGRAGREQKPGEVMIQTAFPEHPFWGQLIEGGYARIADGVLAERKATRWPPYSRLALLRTAAHRRTDAFAFLELARERIESHASERLRVLGPVDAPMARKAGLHRAQLLLQSSDRPALHRLLSELRPVLEASTAARKVRWSIDVDPLELF